MNRSVLVFITLLLAGTSHAETIVDIQSGLIPENTIVTIEDVVVVATRSNGAFVAEHPYGASRRSPWFSDRRDRKLGSTREPLLVCFVVDRDSGPETSTWRRP